MQNRPLQLAKTQPKLDFHTLFSNWRQPDSSRPFLDTTPLHFFPQAPGMGCWASNPFSLNGRILCKDTSYYILCKRLYFACFLRTSASICAMNSSSEERILILKSASLIFIRINQSFQTNIFKHIEPTDSCLCPQHTPAHLCPQQHSKAE